MKKIIAISLVGLFFLSGFGAGAYAKNDSNEFLKVDALTSYDMVIIAPACLSDAIIPLIDHKNSVGIYSFLKTTDEIYNEYEGRDAAEQIKYFIKDAIELWNIRYVLLAGGKDNVPVRYVTTYFEDEINYCDKGSLISYDNVSDLFISDLYYADIYDQNGSFCTWDSNNNNNNNNNNIFGEANSTEIIDYIDLYPDIYVGRILCSNSDEVSTVVSKIIDYEMNTYGEEWFNNIVLCGGDTHPYTWEEYILKIFFRFMLDARCRVAFEGEYLCNCIASEMNGFSANKLFASGILGIRAQLLTVENINNEINNGAGFFLFCGHGSPNGMPTFPPFAKNGRVKLPYPNGYKTSDIFNLSNGGKLPIAVFNTCSNGDFDTVDSPIAWDFIQYGDGGSIVSYAATTEGNTWPTTYTSHSLLSLLALNLFKIYADGVDISGNLWGQSIIRYLNNDEAWEYTPIAWDHHLTIEEWSLFGDPSLKIGGYP